MEQRGRPTPDYPVAWDGPQHQYLGVTGSMVCPGNRPATCRQTSALGDLKYVWTMPSWPLTVMQKSREHRRDLDDLIQRGQIAWHALPYTFHIDFSGPEDIIHSLHYAAELSEAYKKPLPISAKMTDVPGHGRILPTILAGAGIRFSIWAAMPSLPRRMFPCCSSGKVLTAAAS